MSKYTMYFRIVKLECTYAFYLKKSNKTPSVCLMMASVCVYLSVELFKKQIEKPL